MGRGLSQDSACPGFHPDPFLSPQQSTKVPQTPLHTSRVLKEDKERWEDVKVRERLARRAWGGSSRGAGGAGWRPGPAFSHPRGFCYHRTAAEPPAPLTGPGQRSLFRSELGPALSYELSGPGSLKDLRSSGTLFLILQLRKLRPGEGNDPLKGTQLRPGRGRPDPRSDSWPSARSAFLWGPWRQGWPSRSTRPRAEAAVGPGPTNRPVPSPFAPVARILPSLVSLTSLLV